MSEGPFAAANPFRFSTKFTDPETGHLYYGYRCYAPEHGRWLSRDPIGEIQRPNTRSENRYSLCGNSAVASSDYLGLWRRGEHQSLTSSSFWAAWNFLESMNTRPCEGRKLLSVISGANVDTDSGSDQNDLKKHFNRGLKEDINSARQAAADYVCTGADEFRQLLQGTPSKSNCEKALMKLGTLSHTWQDYYAHMIGLNSPFRGDPGPIEGDPYVPSMNLKPSSWGGPASDWGEHGSDEPAWREGDGGVNRRQQAALFTTDQFRFMLAAWLEKCRCNCAKN